VLNFVIVNCRDGENTANTEMEVVEVMGYDYERYFPFAGWLSRRIPFDPLPDKNLNTLPSNEWKWIPASEKVGEWEYAFDFGLKFSSAAAINDYVRKRMVHRSRGRVVVHSVKEPVSEVKEKQNHVVVNENKEEQIVNELKETHLCHWMKFVLSLHIKYSTNVILRQSDELRELRNHLARSNERATSAFTVARNSLRSSRAWPDEDESDSLDDESNHSHEHRLTSKEQGNLSMVAALNQQFNDGTVDIDDYALVLAGITKDDSFKLYDGEIDPASESISCCSRNFVQSS